MPPWLNLLVTFALRTPVLHRLTSASTLLLTFTGRKSGRRYTIPVVYLRRDARTLLVTTDSRWAHNLTGGAPVQVRLRGRDMAGRATTSVLAH